MIRLSYQRSFSPNSILPTMSLRMNCTFCHPIRMLFLSMEQQTSQRSIDVHIFAHSPTVIETCVRSGIRHVSFASDSSPIRYHQLCATNASWLCFRDNVYLCIGADRQTSVECLPYDYQSDRCSSCLADGLCLRGDQIHSTDFLCICPPCYSGKYCQFNTRLSVFTLDQLFSADLLSDRK